MKIGSSDKDKFLEKYIEIRGLKQLFMNKHEVDVKAELNFQNTHLKCEVIIINANVNYRIVKCHLW